MFYIFSLVLFFGSLCSAETHNTLAVKVNNTENILCRDCGTPVLASDTIITKLSAASLHSFNDTLFNRKEVLVQLLVQDIFLRYPIITSSEATCVGKGDWEDDELWFPGHVMKPCFCPECGAFVGWIFESDNSTSVDSYNNFFGLILANLIGENFVKSLLIFPSF